MAVGLAALCVSVPASPAAADDFHWEATMTEAGEPTLGVWPTYGTLGGEVAVFRCPAGAAECDGQPLPVSAVKPELLSVALGSPASGDSFEARLSKAGKVVTTIRTPAWRGVPAVVRAPTLIGKPIVGHRVRMTLGTWTGGWDAGWPGGWRNDASNAVVVCRTKAGAGCVLLARSYDPKPPLDAGYAGRYLFALSRIYFWNGWVSAQLAPPYPIGDLKPSPVTTISAPLGPIVTPAPSASIRARALRGHGRMSVGRVTCRVRCAVRLTVSGGGKTVRRTLTVTGTRALTIAPRRGRLHVKVVVDGKTLASGFSRAR
jgi:hypothetical protein